MARRADGANKAPAAVAPVAARKKFRRLKESALATFAGFALR